MVDSNRFHRWQPDREQLENLTPLRARDLVVQCFFEAQSETIARTQERLRISSTADSIRSSAQGSLRAAFRRTGGSYDAPSRTALQAAVKDLMGASAAMGTPDDIIEHHKKIIDDVLARLAG